MYLNRDKFSTLAPGITLKTKREITKNDIITLCNLLGSKDEYANLYEFKPEPICEGGILFVSKDETTPKRSYKSVRLGIRYSELLAFIISSL